MMIRSITRGRRAHLSLSLIVALGLLLSLAPAGLAAPPEAPNGPEAPAEGFDENDPTQLWVQPTGPLSWEAAAPAERTPPGLPAVAAAPGATSPLVMCSATGADMLITAGNLTTVVECALTTTQAGSVYVAANATASAQGNDVEGSLRIGVDGTSWPYDRAVSVYTSAAQVRNKVATINGLQPIGGPGVHTVRLEARRSSGSGTLRLALPSVTAIFIPSGGTFRTCNNAVDGAWTTTSSGSLPVVACNLSAPTSGYLFFAVNGWLTTTDGDYEAFYRVQKDEAALPTPGDDVTYRRQNVYGDYYGGGDDTFTVTGIRWVDAGTRTTTLRAGKWSGSGPGTVRLNDATVAAFFFTPGDAQAQVCEDQVSESWFTPYPDFGFARRCQLNLPQPSKVFMSADGYAGQYQPSPGYPYAVGPYEMGARLGVDSVSGIGSTQRQINVVEDGKDMSDMGFANSAVRSVASGSRTFYWSGALLSGANVGTAAVYRLGLAVIAIPETATTALHTYMPAISK